MSTPDSPADSPSPSSTASSSTALSAPRALPWPPPHRAGQTDRLFYDGACGLCHFAVNFTLEHDATGQAFRYSPLQSEHLDEALPKGVTRDQLPDSVVVLTTRGELLVKSDAALYMGMKMGGVWRALAHLGALIPRALRDVAYDLVAAVRHRLFAKPQDACPMLPPALRSRFDL